ncbi:MAG: A24 family peptidase [Chloroflexota bacterium]
MDLPRQAASVALILSVVVAAYWDYRWRRLPNWLTFGVAALGIGLGFVDGGPGGAADRLFGWVLGCLLLSLPFLLGGMGAGDVKLMGAVGALMGASFVFWAFMFSALAGGVLALAVLLARGELAALLRRGYASLAFLFTGLWRYHMLPPLTSLLPAPVLGESGAARALDPAAKRRLTLPYAVAIAAGSLLALALGH